MNEHRSLSPFRVALCGLLAGLLACGNVALAAPARSSLQAESFPGSPRLTVVTVAVDGGLEGAAGELSHLAEQAALRSGRFQLHPLAPALEGEAAAARAQRGSEAEAAMAEGQRVYEELDTVAALAQFEKAANLYAQTDLSRTFQKWVEAQLLRAACLVANGELKVAEVELDRVLALEPRAQLSANHFPPESLAYAEKVRKSVASLATATLKVTSAPAGARIFLDGRFQGVAPVELSGLTQADHFVTAVMPGRALVQRRARSGTVALELPPAAGAATLDQAAADIRLDPQGPGRDKALRALGQAVKADQVLAVLVRRGALADRLALTGLRLEVADGHNAGWAELEPPADDSLPVNAEPFLARLLGADAPRRGGPQTHFAVGAGGDNWLGWGVLGGGVALVAGGALFGVLALGKASEYRGLQQTNPAAPTTAATGRTFALLADVGMVAGLAAAGVGTYLALTARPTKPPPRPAPPLPVEAPPRKGSRAPVAAPPTPAKDPAASDAGGSPSSAPAAEAERKKSRRELEEEQRREKAEKRKAAEEGARLEREERKRAAEEKRRAAEESARDGGVQGRTAEPAVPEEEPPTVPRKASPQAPESAPPPEPKPDTARQRADEERQRREDEERRKREDEEKRKREDEETRKREDEEKRKREDEEKRKREDEKKRRSTDDDDLRNY